MSELENKDLAVATENTMQVADDYEGNIFATAQLPSYCSFKADSEEEKQKLYAMMQDPEKRIADMINMKINIKDIYVVLVEMSDKETGEITRAPRTVILDDKGVTYSATSKGIFSSIADIIKVFGEPSTWKKPLTVTVKKVTINDKGHSVLKLSFK